MLWGPRRVGFGTTLKFMIYLAEHFDHSEKNGWEKIAMLSLATVEK